MSESANTLPPEWRECAAETVRTLSIARHLAARHATEETPESILLPALLLSIALARLPLFAAIFPNFHEPRAQASD